MAIPATPLDLAYIAGFFDGEGYVTIRRANRSRNQGKGISYRTVVGFTNTDMSVLTWIQSIVGGRIYKKSRYSHKHSVAFELCLLRVSDVIMCLTGILPYLRIKQAQAELGLDLIALGKMKKSGTWPTFAALPQEVAIREDIKQRMTTLNMRGTSCLQ
jgi:hypothetical protein